MTRVCGTACVAPRMSRRIGRRLPTHLLAIVGAGLAFAAFASVALAAGGSGSDPPRPQPEKLWNAYPLDAPPTQTTPTSRPRPKPVSVASKPTSSGGGADQLLLWIGVAALGAALVAFVVSRRRPAVVRLDGKLGERLRSFHGAVAHTLRDLGTRSEERLTLVASGGVRLPWSDVLRRPSTPTRVARIVDESWRERGAASRPDEGTAQLVQVSEPDVGAQQEAARETSVLRRKRAESTSNGVDKLKENGVEKLKEKKQHSRKPENPSAKTEKRSAKADDDVTLLKAKLAEPAEKVRAVAMAPRAPARPQGRGTARREEETCRIVWWRGYVKSEFYASVRTRKGDAVLMRSPAFRWNKPTPPPANVDEAMRAHEALVADLAAAGWVAAGRGDEWYALELEPRAAGSARRAQKGER